MKKFIGTVLFSAAFSLHAEPGFDNYVEELKVEAASEGISQATIDAAFTNAKFYPRAVKADKQQPEFKLTLDTYLPRAVPDWKVQQARALYKKHYPLLKEIEKKYKVQPRFIIALWGVESNFGKFTGNYSVVSALATMSYEGRREAFFKKELMNALRILEDGHIEPNKMKGSWAGAMGQVQFMPSSFLAYAQDFDGDGNKDIWNNTADALASAANYLAQSGWNNDLTWGRQVKLPNDYDATHSGLKVKKSLSEWQAMGVRRYDGTNLPIRDIQASIVQPDDAQGRAYLAYDNYQVLMKWNRSHYFVAAVGTLADRIAYPPVF
ncbi:lytic transglycosylase domain-containing protein [Agarivorans sp. Toyoura001]|uniref:lytic murein transglycosylase n=1 Tax=unclassified Agarivorans TaxID=2636026 RepID=UPI0010D6F596|nr:lytic murein transglycosylase [Agarivorans sp. Toyoura001]GDY27466.1 lytic transglycosylase [Agarivorans sp. Toyoura001]